MESHGATALLTNKDDRQARAMQKDGPDNGWLDGAFEKGICYVLAVLLLLSIAFMGGRYDWSWLGWSEAVFAGTIGLATVLWLIRLSLRPQLGIVFSWCLVLPLGGVLIGLLQLADLPGWALQFCSPGISSSLPLWYDDGTSAATMGTWSCLSLAPYCTTEAVRYWTLYCLTFFLVIQNIRTFTSVQRLLQIFVFLGVGTAFFGIIQYLSWNGKAFWFFDIPFVPSSNTCRGPFTNRNHFAGYLAMVVGPCCYWLLSMLGLFRRGSSSTTKLDFFLPIGCFALAITLLAAFLTVSRGGIIATTLAFAVAAGGLTFYIRSRKIWLLITTLTCITFAGFLSYAGTEQIQERLGINRGANGAASTSEVRLVLWQALLDLIPNFPVMGTGFGTHQHVYQLSMTKYYDVRFTHAENCYLQILTEGGILAAALAVAAFGFLGFWCVTALRGTRRSDIKPCLIGILAALAAAAFQGAVDFVWYLPSHALVLAVLAGLALVMARLQNPGKIISLPAPSRLGIGLVGVASPFLFGMWLHTTYHKAVASTLWTEFQRSPDGDFADKDARADRVFDDTLLVAALESRPECHSFHASLAQVTLDRVLDSQEWKALSMPLGQIGQAVENSYFESAEKRNRWLEAVCGSENRKRMEKARAHFQQAIERYPLHASSYLRLAELHFLAEPESPTPKSLLTQAVKADPANPDICYEAGRQFFMMEDTVRAMACWRQSALVSEKHKQTILVQLATAVPLPALIEHFQPDYNALMWLYRERFAGREHRKNRSYLLSQVLQVTQKETDPKVVGQRMRFLFILASQDGAQEQALQCARTAVAAEPYDCAGRVMLARAFFNLGKFAESRTELEWCAVREPGNAEVQALRNAVFDAVNNRRTLPVPLTPASLPRNNDNTPETRP